MFLIRQTRYIILVYFIYFSVIFFSKYFGTGLFILSIETLFIPTAFSFGLILRSFFTKNESK
jgi:hypothetical protein